MKGSNLWNNENPTLNKEVLTVHTAVPGENSVHAVWKGRGSRFRVYCVERETGECKTADVNDNEAVISDLRDRCEYTLYVENEYGDRSGKRIFQTSYAPGITVNYLHPQDTSYGFSGRFLCSPSIVKTNSGKLLVSMDIFDTDAPQNTTVIYESNDEGINWKYVSMLYPCFWGKLFVFGGDLYMLGLTTEYGDVIVGKSTDDGKTWSSPTVIARGSSCVGEGWHRAPCVVTEHEGRLWTALEFGSWKKGGFSNAVMSVGIDEDLMNAENWQISELYRIENISCVIEGNIVVGPNGDLFNFLRCQKEKAAILRVNAECPQKKLEFVKFSAFPAAHTKFEIQRCSNGKYYAVGNKSPYRNVLALYSSDNLEDWTHERDIINYENADEKKVGFQYPSFIVDNDELLLVSRTAFGGAENFHNSNRITFHKIKL